MCSKKTILAFLTIFLAADCTGRAPTPASVADAATPPQPSPGSAFDLSYEVAPVPSTAYLSSPLPLATSVSVAAPIVFQVTLDDGISQKDVESGTAVYDQNGALIAGQYTWAVLKPKGVWSLTFYPNAKLAADTTFVVRVAPVGTFAPTAGAAPGATKRNGGSFITAFSTSTAPRVVSIQLVSKDGGKSLTYVRIGFSEEMDGQSLRGAFSAFSQGANLQGSFSLVPPATREVVYGFQQPVQAAAALTVRIAPAAQSAQKIQLQPRSYDSPTNVGGAFQIDLAAGSLSQCLFDKNCWQWMPNVN